MEKCVSITELVGKTFSSVEKKNVLDGDELRFVTTDGVTYRMYHGQDCCEMVWLEDICGELEDLVDTPMLEAREDTNWDEAPPEGAGGWDSYTWTFYNFQTAKGHVTLRWYGESNGYYSESVNICKNVD